VQLDSPAAGVAEMGKQAVSPPPVIPTALPLVLRGTHRRARLTMTGRSALAPRGDDGARTPIRDGVSLGVCAWPSNFGPSRATDAGREGDGQGPGMSKLWKPDVPRRWAAP
jgi:hypothetical protein